MLKPLQDELGEFGDFVTAAVAQSIAQTLPFHLLR